MSGSGGDLNNSSQIEGATDSTLIGNVGDRLKVDISYSGTGFGQSFWTNTLRYDDMNTTTGGINRQTSVATSAVWTQVYIYSGRGNIAGMVLTLESFQGWEFRLVVDNTNIFSFSDADITSDAVYDLDEPTFSSAIGLSHGNHDKFIWHPPLNYPLRYLSSVKVEVRRPTAGAKKFEAGLMILSKDA